MWDKIGLILLGVTILLSLGLISLQKLTIDRLRAQLKAQREREISNLQNGVNALQLLQKYQTYLKEKGIPLP